MRPERRRDVIALVLTLVVFALDQGSKLMASVWLRHGPVTVVPGYFDLVLTRNPDVAFSMLGFLPGKRWIFCAMSTAAVVLMAVFLRRSPPERRLRIWALGILAGGALGNLLDRLLTGEVVDFVLWHVHQLRWPVFNIADGALLIGVALLIIDDWSSRRVTKAQPAA